MTKDISNHMGRRAGGKDAAKWFDLSVVSDPLVVQALGELLGEDRMRKRWEGLAHTHRHLHQTILLGFLEHARAPLRLELAGDFGEKLDTGLADLVARDLILVQDGEVAGAYPFTSHPARHLVEIEGREISAMCAIDALGAGAMARRDARVRACCAHCDAPIRLSIAGQGLAIDAVTPPTALVWAGVVAISGCAADSQCQSMLLLCCRAHLDAWLADHPAQSQGFCLTPAQALQLGAAIFRPFLQQAEVFGDQQGPPLIS